MDEDGILFGLAGGLRSPSNLSLYLIFFISRPVFIPPDHGDFLLAVSCCADYTTDMTTEGED
jgi:hypothetical protein